MHSHGSIHLLLVADGSPATDAAARAVHELIDPAAIGRVTVVAVGRPVGGNDWRFSMLGFVGCVPQTLVDDAVSQSVRWAKTETERVAGLLGGVPGPIARVTRVGDPCAETIAVAREIGADVIVAGVGGRDGSMRTARRGIAAELVRRAPCPVLAVRPGMTSHPSPKSGKRVHIAVPALFRPVCAPLAGLGASASVRLTGQAAPSTATTK